MKLIKPKVRYISQEQGLVGVYKHIEYAMRNCYRSQDKITEDSYKGMIRLALTNKHHSVLEHGTIYLSNFWLPKEKIEPIYERYNSNPYSKCRMVQNFKGDFAVAIVSNYRVLYENGWLKDLNMICKETNPLVEHRYTFEITTSIGIAREFNRHRCLSISEQSTRYCNYSKDKFGGEVTFIIPSWYGNGNEGDFIKSCAQAEKVYLSLIAQGAKPQEAREVLPLSTSTTVIYTGFKSDWERIIKERSSSNAHPDAQLIAKEIKEILNKETRN